MKLIKNYLYVLWSPDFPWRFKVGISNAPHLRAKQIADELSYIMGYRVKVFVFIKIPLPWPLTIEQGLHHATRKLQCSMPEHGGKTEWRWGANPVFSLLFFLLLWAYDWMPGSRGFWSCLILILPLPFDLALCAVILAAVEYAVIAGGAYLVFGLILPFLLNFIA